jgi:NitT/TauT family transport system substrate-binding protein
MMKTVPMLFLVMALALVPAPPSAGAEDSLPMLKVGHVGHDHQLALYVAADAGRSLEKDYGVYLEPLKDQEVYDLWDGGRRVARLNMIRVGGGSKMPAALEQGHIEVGLGGLGPTVKFVDKGSPLKVLAPLNNDGDMLVVRKDFPAGNWKDFVVAVRASERPVRIGYKDPLSVAYLILVRALEAEGLTYGPDMVDSQGAVVNVVTVNLQGLDNSLPSMEGGIVDGVVVNEPTGSLLVYKGVGKAIADLSSLPPEGKWEGHPCCIVAARTDVIKEKRPIVVSLLKVIAAGGDLIAREPSRALAAEGRWTKTSPEVGKMSIPNVSYVIRPDAVWVSHVDTWVGLMGSAGQFQKVLKGMSDAEVRDTVLDLGPMNEALSGMKLLGK